jgi:hypothetical protein
MQVRTLNPWVDSKPNKDPFHPFPPSWPNSTPFSIIEEFYESLKGNGNGCMCVVLKFKFLGTKGLKGKINDPLHLFFFHKLKIPILVHLLWMHACLPSIKRIVRYWNDYGCWGKWSLKQKHQNRISCNLSHSLSEWNYSPQRVTQLQLHVFFVPVANLHTSVS